MEYIDIIIKEYTSGESAADIQAVDPSGNDVQMMFIDIEEDHDGYMRIFRIQRKNLD